VDPPPLWPHTDLAVVELRERALELLGAAR
jgi:hypothetical protein